MGARTELFEALVHLDPNHGEPLRMRLLAAEAEDTIRHGVQAKFVLLWRQKPLVELLGVVRGLAL